MHVLRSLTCSRWVVASVVLCLASTLAAAQDAQPAPQDAQPAPAAALPPANAALIDGHVREGAFLSGPGSLTFILHHTLMGAAAGFATQGIATGFDLSLSGRETMLAGALIGAGLGFGSSAWWQFYNWIGSPMASYGVVNSVLAGMALVGLVDLFTDDKLAITWTSFIGVELGAWLTATLGGGDMPVNHGLLIASGGLWGLVYATLTLAMVNTGGKLSAGTWVDSMFLTSGLAAGGLALATLQYDPTSAQILRADLFGLGVGGAVFLLSEVVLGLNFNQAAPYALAMVSSAGAIAAVSLLWEEAAEKPEDKALGQSAWYFYRSRELDRPYACVWW